MIYLLNRASDSLYDNSDHSMVGVLQNPKWWKRYFPRRKQELSKRIRSSSLQGLSKQLVSKFIINFINTKLHHCCKRQEQNILLKIYTDLMQRGREYTQWTLHNSLLCFVRIFIHITQTVENNNTLDFGLHY